MFAAFLITLREGLEAALVVSILIAYLVKTDRGQSVRYVWAGVGAAAVFSLAVGGALALAADELPEEAQAAFEGLMALLAVAFVTWMVFWMARNARQLKGQLQEHLDKAAAAGAGALAAMAFIAVSREGFETALFLWTSLQTTGGGWLAILGGLLGLVAAVALGVLIYRGALRINLSTFFKWTGIALIVIAAGVFTYGIHELQEAGLLPGEDSIAFDASGAFPSDSVQYTLVRGLLSVRTVPSWLEVFAWFAYLVPVMAIFLRMIRTPPRPLKASEQTPASA
ncbi:MAG: iron uptake transporter permease EfeU [Actinomycetes bacterium]